MKRKILKTTREKKDTYGEMNKDKDNSRYLIRNNASEKTVEQHL